MKPLPLLLTAVVIGIVSALGVKSWRDGQAHAAEVTRLTALADSFRQVSARTDTVYQRDTVRLWRTLRDLDTLTVTVEQWKRDTIKVVEYVERAEAAAEACSATILTCEQRVALRDQRLAIVTDSLPRAVNAQWESRMRAVQRQRLRDMGLAGVVGVAACALWCPR